MSTRTLREVFVVTNELRDRFFSKTVSASTGCMIWTGAVQRNGYGAFKIDGHKIDAHVASWRIANDGIGVPLGLLVMHMCDCRPCVNPSHLALGTNAENMRHAHIGDKSSDYKRFGEQCSHAKLTDDIVRTIRSLYVPNKFGYRRIARHLGLTEKTVASVCYGKSWKHVTTEATE